MKKKSLASVTALLLTAGILCACTESNYKVTFKDYWFADANVPTASTETLVYDVSFEKSKGFHKMELNMDTENRTLCFHRIHEYYRGCDW